MLFQKKVSNEWIGKRVDLFLAEFTKLTRKRVKELINSRSLKINGAVKVRSNYILEKGDDVKFGPYENHTTTDIQIKYIDDYLMVVSKPNDMVVYGKKNGLIELLAKKYPEQNELKNVETKGLAHRIDKHTTGLVIIGRDDKTLEKLFTMIKEKQIKRKYLALVEGHIKDKMEYVIDAPLQKQSAKVVVNKKGKSAITKVTVKSLLDQKRTLVECELETGRTHQIRVHMAHDGHPIVGDYLYGPRTETNTGQLLHSYYVEFIHPVTKDKIVVEDTNVEWLK